MQLQMTSPFSNVKMKQLFSNEMLLSYDHSELQYSDDIERVHF